MFLNKTTCNECHQEHDALEHKCPKCQSDNRQFDNLKLSKNILVCPVPLQIALFLVGSIGFQLIGFLVELILLKISGLSAEDFAHSRYALLITIISYMILILIMSVLVIKQYKSIGKSFVGKSVYLSALLGLVFIYIASTAYSMIISLLYEVKDNNNQEALENIISVYPILSIIIFGVVGPICEELTYRVGLFTFLRRWNRIGAYIVTILVFAFIHFDWFSFGNIEALINELINIPSYIIAGLVLTYLYDNYGFASSTLAHIFNNLISVTISIIMSLCLI